MGIESVLNSVVENLKEVRRPIKNFWEQFLGWFDKVFPPETRGEKLHYWLHIALPFVVAGVLLTLVLCCYKECCCERGSGGRRGLKIMKAPRIGGNPKSYFRNLRANPGDELC